VKGAETPTSAEKRAWFEADRRLHEKLTLRDIGVWSHYVADASQPLHVSVHMHAYFEGEFAQKNLKRDAVAALVPAYAPTAVPDTNNLNDPCAGQDPSASASVAVAGEA
jgi:hypothetical protein